LKLRHDGEEVAKRLDMEAILKRHLVPFL
jgi:hypothetical protein